MPSCKEKKKVLLFTHISTHFKEMWRVALLLKSSEDYCPIVYFHGAYEGYEIDLELCKAHEVPFLLFTDFEAFTVPLDPPKKINANRKIRFSINKVLNTVQNLPANLRSAFNKAKLVVNNIDQKLNKLQSFFKFSPAMPIFKVKAQELLFIFKLFASCVLFFSPLITWVIKGLKPKKSSKTTKAPKNRVHPFLIWLAIFTAKKWEFPWKIAIKFYPWFWRKYIHMAPTRSRHARVICQAWPSFLNKHEISLLVLPEHNLFYYTQLIVHLTHQLKIPAVIVPFTIANTIEWAESFYTLSSSNLNFAINRVLAKKYPSWKLVYKNKPLILPAEVILINEMFGTTPKVPWLINSGTIDAIAAESSAMHDYYLKAGIEREVLKITGALYDDELHAQLSQADEKRKSLYKDLGFQDSFKPMLLFAFPPDQLSNRENKCEFKKFKDIVEYFFKILDTVTHHYNVVINLHPRVKEESLAIIEDFPQLKISKLNIANLIPLSALYVASCSATIRMAVACGIPVLNYDLYRYDYDDYKSAKGVITVGLKKEFEHEINLLTNDPHYYENLQKQQQQISPEWGMVDGKSGERLLALFDSLLLPKNESGKIYA